MGAERPPQAVTAEELLYTDLDGSRVGLDEVIADGLERDYSGRYDGLRDVLAGGSPAHRLWACVMLASWGVRDGLLTVVDWAEEPERVPWAAEPVSFDRMFGVDDAFGQLARALETAGDVELTPVGVRLRVAATRALLGLYDRVFFDRWMQVLVGRDQRLAAAARVQIEQAIERAAAGVSRRPPFDLATQAAELIGPLAALDDDRAASLSYRVVFAARDWPRALREVAAGLGSGTGQETLYALQRLADSPHAEVASEARTWLARREAAGSGG